MASKNVRKSHNAHLQDTVVAAEYLNNAFASNDPAVILVAIRNVVDAQEMGISGLAEKTQLERQNLYRILSSSGNPELGTLTSILRALGFELTVSKSKKAA